MLKLQKRKSIPSVVIQEFVGDDDKQADEDCEDADAKVKTHHRIDDFGSLKLDDPKHIGLEEVSPLEGKNGVLKDNIDDEI